jgi:hypothetical protein
LFRVRKGRVGFREVKEGMDCAAMGGKVNVILGWKKPNSYEVLKGRNG